MSQDRIIQILKLPYIPVNNSIAIFSFLDILTRILDAWSIYSKFCVSPVLFNNVETFVHNTQNVNYT